MPKYMWDHSGQRFYPAEDSSRIKKVPPGIYTYVQTLGGWYLERTHERFEFPFKIYGTHDHIVNRIERAWKALPSNFGVLLNGLKGTGKTVTAQLIINWAIENGFVVLNADTPVPLGTIMGRVEQDMVVIFDEFEKTHAKPEEQQSILSDIDGLGRSKFRRLFLFTTNNKKINENFIDRPSRIRYTWEFKRLEADVIEEILDDLLDPALSKYRTDILAYLEAREVLSIDVVKTVIQECNIFKETPDEFESFMNLTEREPPSYKIEWIHEDGKVDLVTDMFRPSSERDSRWVQALFTKSGKISFIENFASRGQSNEVHSTNYIVDFVAPTDVKNEFMANVGVPNYKVPWVKSFKVERHIYDKRYLEEKPKDWKVPDWVGKVERDEKLTKEDQGEMSNIYGTEGIYLGADLPPVRIRLTKNQTGIVSSYQYKGPGAHFSSF